MNNLLYLIDCGQSYWLDNLTRGKIIGGELKERVITEGLRGVTTNPSIFNRAISKSKDYDHQLMMLFHQGKEVREVYEELAVKDVQDACDILRPVYDESECVDGFVSLEVSPLLARDTEGTMVEARRLFKKVDRRNCFIKIPATDQGIPAIEEMLFEGININITLIFSIQRYEAVAEAYIKALERRLAAGQSVKHMRSVASFFLSRIDVLVDDMLTHLPPPVEGRSESHHPQHLLGRAAVANAKLAYRAFGKIFDGERWHSLAQNGAFVQRPLWASTGTKNPDYDDVKYVEPLIGQNTVNTMPEDTIAAFADHGVATKDSIQAGVEDAERDFGSLESCGIRMDVVAQQLLADGVNKFREDYDTLLRNLMEKRDRMVKGTAPSKS